MNFAKWGFRADKPITLPLARMREGVITMQLPVHVGLLGMRKYGIKRILRGVIIRGSARVKSSDVRGHWYDQEYIIYSLLVRY